jgi:predicted RNA polymerase sigma factor
LKKHYHSTAPLATLSLQYESQRILAVLVRILGLHRLNLALALVENIFEEAVTNHYFRTPANPPEFLLALARVKTLDLIRQQNLAEKLARSVALDMEMGQGLEQILQQLFSEPKVEESRLALVFACCHPALPMRIRMALLLKTSFTFTEKDIRHFRHSEDLELLRELEAAPELILQNNVQVTVPSERNFKNRYEAVLETIWQLFHEGFEHSEKIIFTRRALCDQAFQLAQCLLSHPPSAQPSTYALMSMLCLLSARFDVRRGRAPSFIFLDEKNRAKWNMALIDKGVSYFEQAGELDKTNEYHLMAQALLEHTLAPHPRFTNWESILNLYEALLKVHPVYRHQLYFAWLLAKNDQPQTAIQHLYAVHSFSEHLLEDWQTNALMGDFYRLSKNLREGIRYYRVAQQKAPSQALKRLLARKIIGLEKGTMRKKKAKW